MTENTTEVEETFETDSEGVAYTSESDASADTPARPARKVRTMAGVMAFGNAETPWSDTPWSPAKMTARTRSTGTGGTWPWVAATHTASSPR